MHIEIYANRESVVIERLFYSAKKVNCAFVDNNLELAPDLYLFVYLPEELANRHIPPTLPKLVDCSNKHPEKTIFCFAEDQGIEQITNHQLKSIRAVGKLVEDNGAKWLTQLPNSLDAFFDCKEPLVC
ncbi:hypothetical protein A7985_03750 [Pseudoalteromonas luteoviolacea]|uniref:Uncharacterized protein n=1 Tax=Pseudoalteromonas luteoviolacea TaxID=43657 RepID=A0A1C0TUS4_9GAMM|nr:hypothetical protein [Pseudoalteromonas luteoviolacea]OCQ23077.1 hypothetical protein A7985_03750 [Pseudoalteromonas luteoviolacea]